MGYYVRAFCTSSVVPPIRAVLEWTAQQGYTLQVDPDSAEVDLDSPDWQEVDIIYKDGKQPFVVGVDRDDGSEASLVRREIEEFEEFLADVTGPAKARVLTHLRATRYIVANQLLADVDDDGYEASSIFLTYFVEHCGGLIQADSEGFYEGDELIVELE